MKHREIKFRAWDGYKMEYNVTVCLGKQWNMREGRPIEGYPLMQFTGLKDKNGKEMCEGDIVSAHGTLGVVEWDNGLALFTLKVKINNERGDMTIYTHQENGLNVHREIVGNIHENPELL